MSDTRSSSFQVPAPRTDDVSTDADAAAVPGRPGEGPVEPGPDAKAAEEDAPTARWPVPDYAEPPTGAWDRLRPQTGDQPRQPLWPVAEPDAPTPHDGARRPIGDDDPETFSFDRPSWDEPPQTSSGGHAAPPSWARHPSGPVSPSWDQQAPGPSPSWGREESGPASRAGEHASGSYFQPGQHARQAGDHASGPQAWDGPTPPAGDRQAPPPPVPAWEAPPASASPSSDGFSYWERRVPEAPAPPPPGWDTRGSAPSGFGGPGIGGGARSRRPSTEAAWDAPAPEAEEAPEARPAKRPREPYLDNVKFLLITLVVTGHSLVPTLSAHSSRSAYLFIYVFHMPLFVIISGYLSRNFWNSNAKTNKLVDTFLMPYVVVELGYALLRFAFGHKFSLTIIDPAWLNWYLLALLLWRLSTPVWKRMRYPLPIAVAVYLLAGLSDLPGDFSMDRFFGLMPFFVLGLLLQPHHFDMLDRLWVKILAVGVLAGAAAVAIFISPRVPLDPIYYKDSYADLHMSWWMGMAMRAALLVAALLVSAAVLALVPRKNTWFSDLGTRTLYCYLLHGVPVYIAKEMGWLGFPWLHGPLGVMAITSSCFALAIILCLPETRTVFKWLLEPRLTWLYRRPSAEASAGAR
ncbi:acyltransferase family protein [Sphaerisporangium sp. NPDC051017]|uniref:acyltransferase family protein n=1 Tax=Sphaerisporangium sp. NPDC051017 TaxID=3154636 RepID=UPI003416E6AF